MRHLDYILFTRAGDGRWPRYQAKSLACPGCALNCLKMDDVMRAVNFLRMRIRFSLHFFAVEVEVAV